jgi:hypothetical protein
MVPSPTRTLVQLQEGGVSSISVLGVGDDGLTTFELFEPIAFITGTTTVIGPFFSPSCMKQRT